MKGTKALVVICSLFLTCVCYSWNVRIIACPKPDFNYTTKGAPHWEATRSSSPMPSMYPSALPLPSSTKATTVVASDGSLDDIIVGIHRKTLLVYLSSLFPKKERFVPHQKKDWSAAHIGKNSVAPPCFLSIGGTNIRYEFFNPREKPILWKYEIGATSIRKNDDMTFALTLYPKSGTANISEVVLDYSIFRDNASHVIDHVESLSPQLLPEHLWPSGSILNSDRNTVVAAMHQWWYRVGIFEGPNTRNLRKVKTTGFDGSGGENIGTLFEHREKLFLSVRYNIRKHIHGLSGIGYRQAGIYEVVPSNQDGPDKSYFGRLITQHSDDQFCCKQCGGCIEDQSFVGCQVDADTWSGCHRTPADLRGKGQLLWKHTVRHQTQIESLMCASNATSGRASQKFLDYMKCVYACREMSQSYHSAVTKTYDTLTSVVSFTRKNSIFLCRVGENSMRHLCHEQPMMHLNSCRDGHPVMTGLEYNGEHFFMAGTASNADDYDPKGVLLLSWDHQEFCMATQRDKNEAATFNSTIRLEGAILAILFRPDSASCGESSNFELGLSVGTNTGPQEVPLFEVRDVLSFNKTLCGATFHVPFDCVQGCDIVIRFKHLSIHGISGGINEASM